MRATTWPRVVFAVMVAAIVAFAVFRVAIALPGAGMWHTCHGAVVPQWDPLTGWFVLPECTYLTPIEPLEHWYRAFFAGLAGGLLALVAGLVWALGRLRDVRRRSLATREARPGAL
jgi:hypothetical protein